MIESGTTLPPELIPIILTLAPSLIGAFSRAVRAEILARDNHRCVNCGSKNYLEASHINHDRNNPNYNHPDTGETLCTLCHLESHLQEAGRNGLSEEHNDWAIGSLISRARSRYTHERLMAVLQNNGYVNSGRTRR